MPPAWLGLQLLQSGAGFGGEPRLHARHSFIQIAKVSLLHRSSFGPQPAVEERAPFRIHLGSGCFMAVGSQHKAETLRCSEQPVHLLCTVVIAPALAIVGVAAAI